MEPLSEANVIVERMLVNYFNTLESERDQLIGSEQIKKAWGLIRAELEQSDKTELADAFQEHPFENQRNLTTRLGHMMRKNEELARALRFLMDQYLQQMYSGTINVSQEVSTISNASGVIKGGTVVGVRIDSLERGKSSGE